MNLRQKEQCNYNIDDHFRGTMLPFLDYRSEGLVDRLYIPQITNDDKNLWVMIELPNVQKPIFAPFRTAVNLYSGDENNKSYISFVNAHINHPSMTAAVWRQIKKEAYVKIKPDLQKGDYCYLVTDGELSLEASYVKLESVAKNRTVLFTDVDDYLLYNVIHFIPRLDTFTAVNRETAKDIGLTKWKGSVSRSWLIPISNELIVDGIDYGFIAASQHYYKLKCEALQSKIKNITNLFHLTNRQMVQAIAQKMRARCIKKNEGKIFIDTYKVPGAMLLSTLMPKYATMKNLNSYEELYRKGESYYAVFKPQKTAHIYGNDNINRDFDEEGIEVFPDENDEDEIDYTMGISSTVHRCIPTKNILSVKYNICRNQQYEDQDDKIFGITKEWTNIENAFSGLKVKKSRKRQLNDHCNKNVKRSRNN